MEENSVLLKNGIRNSNLDIKKVKSDFEQQTYEGYNIVPCTTLNSAFEETENGYKNKTSTGVFSVNNNITLKANTTYYLNLIIIKKPTSNTTFSGYTNDTASGTQDSNLTFTNIHTYDENTLYTRTFNATEDTPFSIRTWGNSVGDIYEFQLWLCEGINHENYEPYVGGIPAPSPEYPQEMKVVTGTTSVVITENGETLSTQSIRLGSEELVTLNETYKDELIKENGDYYILKKIKKLVLDGSENWNNTFTSFGLTELIEKGIQSSIAKSDYFIYNNRNSGMNTLPNYQFAIQVLTNRPNSSIYIQDTDFDSVEDFKTWLSNNNVTVYYPLEELTKTKITDTDLISDLENLKLPEDIEDINNLSLTVSGDLAGKLEFTYQQRIII